MSFSSFSFYLLRRFRRSMSLLFQQMLFELCGVQSTGVWCCESPRHEPWVASVASSTSHTGSGWNSWGTWRTFLATAQRVFVQQQLKGLKEIWEHTRVMLGQGGHRRASSLLTGVSCRVFHWPCCVVIPFSFIRACWQDTECKVSASYAIESLLRKFGNLFLKGLRLLCQ